MAGGVMIFVKNSNFRRKKISFLFIKFVFVMLMCSLNLKRQSEPSGLGLDTSSLVYFENLCFMIIKDEFNDSCSYKAYLSRK